MTIRSRCAPSFSRRGRVRPFLSLVLLLALASIAAMAARGQTGTTGSTSQSQVKVQPPASVLMRAKAPAPSANAQKKTTIGGGGASVNTADQAQDSDSVWTERIDIDGDGDIETADLLWDDEDKVLFLADDDTVTCQGGGVGTADLLMAIYGDGNVAKRPSGSGWYVVDLDAGECGARVAGVFGCRFDVRGRATECGAAVVDDTTDDIVITSVRGTSGQ